MSKKLVSLLAVAFVVLLSGTATGLDFGDAPEGPYPTTLAADGARHVIVPGFCLGNSIDDEWDGQPTPLANGDDTDADGDDEDGVWFPTSPLIPGQLGVVIVRNSMGAGATGFLDGWVDFNGDGSWAEPGDRICSSQPLSASGADMFFFQVPATATPNITTFARFRFSSTGYLSYDGLAQDGEVEDYSLTIGQEEEPAIKWIQYPDLSPEGIDVDVTKPPRFVADDFECTATEDLLDIHIWGSWYHDYPSWGVNPTGVTFTLSIHADIPAAQSPTGYSMPGSVLWTRQFEPGQFKVRPMKEKVAEGWYDPVANRFEAVGSYRCWQYSFYLKPGEFRQQGTLDRPVVYWLAVQAQPRDPKARFGWKTSLDHWNDDAVWASSSAYDWNEMRYPRRHPYYPDSIDMAFSLTSEAEGPGQPTSRPVSATQCPVVETRCPPVPTQCPASPTTCPPVVTQCPVRNTRCPADQTICSGQETTCTAVQTTCPALVTECLVMQTNCPIAETQCPDIVTECPPWATHCPPVSTQCPAANTACPPDNTRCPPEDTRCPPDDTRCPPDDTRCPPDDTRCPPDDTRCPEVYTECPKTMTACEQVDTWCPRIDTKCPAPKTRCWVVPTECPIAWTGPCMAEETRCPEEVTKCPPAETECPEEATQCPPVDTQCPPETTRCPRRFPYCWFGIAGVAVERKYPAYPAMMWKCPAIEAPAPTVIAKPLLVKVR